LLRIEDIDAAQPPRTGGGHSGRSGLAGAGVRGGAGGAPVHQAGQLCGGGQAEGAGAALPCRCTRAEIAAAATAHGPDGPLYPGSPAGAARWTARRGLAAGYGPRARAGRAFDVGGRAGWLQVATPEIFGDVVLLRRKPRPPITLPPRWTMRQTASRLSRAGQTCLPPAICTACCRRCWACRCRAGTTTR
jgi:glutamyl-Q tRNA(Asp) synthetase